VGRVAASRQAKTELGCQNYIGGWIISGPQQMWRPMLRPKLLESWRCCGVAGGGGAGVKGETECCGGRSEEGTVPSLNGHQRSEREMTDQTYDKLDLATKLLDDALSLFLKGKTSLP
jgi:hypothetical protein